jgi:hypothetical protein
MASTSPWSFNMPNDLKPVVLPVLAMLLIASQPSKAIATLVAPFTLMTAMSRRA